MSECPNQNPRYQTGRTATIGAAFAWLVAVSCPKLHAGIAVQPYLQNPTTNSMDVLWWTDSSGQCSLEYGPSFSRHIQTTPVWIPLMNRWLHQVTVTGVAPGTAYPYRVRCEDSMSHAYSFTTAPSMAQAAVKGVHVGIMGDGRTDNEAVRRRHREIAHLARSRGAALLFEVGDMVYDGSQVHWDYLLQRVLTKSHIENQDRPTASNVPYMMVVGNHEIYGGAGGYEGGGLTDTMPRFQAVVSHPDNASENPQWKERYYSLKYGPVTFIVLDANNTSDAKLDNHRQIRAGFTPDWEPGSEQYRWMVQHLKRAQSDSAFTVVMCHPASYSRGVHGANDSTIDYQTGYELRALDPVFRQYGVDLVVQSHDHLVERCVTGPSGWWNHPGAFNRRHPNHAAWLNDTRNLNYIVMGNSGEGSRLAHPTWESWMDIHQYDVTAPPGTCYTDYFYEWAGVDSMSSYIDLRITRERGAWQAAIKVIRRDDSNGQVAEFDAFNLTRRSP